MFAGRGQVGHQKPETCLLLLLRNHAPETVVTKRWKQCQERCFLQRSEMTLQCSGAAWSSKSESTLDAEVQDTLESHQKPPEHPAPLAVHD